MLQLVDGDEIGRLSAEAFRRVLNALLRAEVSVHNIPLTALDLSVRNNDPDAGIDAKLEWPASAQHDILPAGEIALQFKSGKLTAHQLREEFRKRGVQETLKAGGSYMLLVGHDYVPHEAKKRRAALKRLCRRGRLDPNKCSILFGSAIAQWACRHLAVVLMPELRKQIPPFITIDRLRQDPELSNPWVPDELRKAIIEEIRFFVAQPAQTPVVRIEGPAGVGKTRLALEALSEPGIAERTICQLNAQHPKVEELLTALQIEPKVQAVVLVDECERERQRMLEPYVRQAAGRVRLICVGPGEMLLSATAGFSPVFALVPLSNEKTSEAVKKAIPGAPPEFVETAVRLSRGFVKLAMFIARILVARGRVPPAELVRIPDIKTFLDKFIEREKRTVLQALSLLVRIGWDEDLRTEAEAVAKYLGVDFGGMQAGVKFFRDHGLVVSRGRYLYVTPDLLAVHAAAELWEERGPDLIGIVGELPGAGPRRELLKRLAMLGPSPQVRVTVEALLGNEGLFKTLGELDDEFRSEIFRILSSALPEAAVEVLDRLIAHAPRDELLTFREGRRNVMWAIESLLRWPETSLQAAAALRALALAENEKWGNNATGIFVQYFHVNLSSSPIALSERSRLVDELIQDGEATGRLLAVKALSGTLALHEIRRGGDVDDLSGRPFPPEWRPKTWGELWDALWASVQKLKTVSEGIDEAALEARKALLGAVYTLGNRGMPERAVELLREWAPRSDEERIAILEACDRIPEMASGRLTAEALQQLAEVKGRTYEDTYLGRLRRWVGKRPHTDYDIEGKTGFQHADNRGRALAEEGLQHGIGDDELTWLASKDAMYVWSFGKRLGELDETFRFLDQIVHASSDDLNSLLLPAYLDGVAERAGRDQVEDILDDLSRGRPLLAFFCTFRGQATERGYSRLVGLVERDTVRPENLTVLVYGEWPDYLSADQLAYIVELMLRGEPAKTFEAAMGLVHRHIERHTESLGRLDPLVWQLLEMRPSGRAGTMLEWEWGELAKKIASRNPASMVRTVIRLFEAGHFVPPEDDSSMEALRLATVADPHTCWNLLAEPMLRGDNVGTGLIVALSQWYGNLIPTDLLVSWAKENQPRGPWIAARLISVESPALPERARALIKAFPDNKGVLDEILANLQTASWTGPYSGRIQHELGMVQSWAEDPDPKIRSWARGVAKGLEKYLQREKLREEEQEL